MNEFNNFTIHQINLISQLKETQGIRDLARRNNMDPARVSRIFQEIERALGFSLATRSKRGFILTTEGAETVALASELIQSFKKFEDLKKIDPAYASIPTFSMGSRAFLSTLIAEVIAKKSIDQTNLKFKFLDSSPTDLLRAMLVGSIDIAIHLENWNLPSSWMSEDVAALTWGLVARSGHEISSKVKIAQTQDYPFVGVSFLAGDRIERPQDVFPLRWSERRIGHECQTAASSKMILKNSNHLAYLPLITVADEIESKKLRVIEVEDMKLIKMNLRLSLNQDRVSQKAKKIVAEALHEIHLRDQKLSKPLKGLDQVDKISNSVSV